MAPPKPSPPPDSARPTKTTLSTEKPPALSFEELAKGGKEVLIEHLGQVYRLRATRNGGLILNK